jgi:hypothetical protein
VSFATMLEYVCAFVYLAYILALISSISFQRRFVIAGYKVHKHMQVCSSFLNGEWDVHLIRVRAGKAQWRPFGHLNSNMTAVSEPFFSLDFRHTKTVFRAQQHALFLSSLCRAATKLLLTF